MPDPLIGLRANTQTQHAALEQRGVFARIMQSTVTRADLTALLGALYRYHARFEPLLLARLAGTPEASLYQPRLALLAGDLNWHGAPLPEAATGELPLASRASRLGVIYAIEGSVLGGTVIERHCLTHLGEEIRPGLQYFSQLSAHAGQSWRRVIDALRSGLAEETALAEASAAANAVFAAFYRLGGD